MFKIEFVRISLFFFQPLMYHYVAYEVFICSMFWSSVHYGD